MNVIYPHTMTDHFGRATEHCTTTGHRTQGKDEAADIQVYNYRRGLGRGSGKNFTAPRQGRETKTAAVPRRMHDVRRALGKPKLLPERTG